ncbi:hypothetical protein BDV32DRAFT_73761 [Aspergillus pseudonomiae]|uniref:Uncharacterized protein n=1 Tax=Aspergillus pseudonomiae TaxID=1506151 RepID=A0A5N7DIB8_9EURO|nr:uncharacterized protein BDV37DRAFT_73586 [Aspergillus pseudonomiae]KAB8264547.1 hypothetical protein BDV32DRAFT_73761 [Aspergillus pseudonomiae]KAE8406074.1 hypothetical protein BDV37DRAFT_73586 [Aspergillus pseudonomiae]
MIGSGAGECVGTTDDVGNVTNGEQPASRRYAPIFVIGMLGRSLCPLTFFSFFFFLFAFCFFQLRSHLLDPSELSQPIECMRISHLLMWSVTAVQ